MESMNELINGLAAVASESYPSTNSSEINHRNLDLDQSAANVTTIEDGNIARIKIKHKGEDLFYLIDKEDEERVREYNWYCDDHGYIRNKTYKLMLHRFIMNVTDPTKLIDHINYDKLDNRKSNLRVVTHSQNMQNQKKYCNNTTGYKGVYLIKNQKWRAIITINKKRKHLGSYHTAEAAAHAYDSAARIYHGEYARYNFPLPGEQSAI
jgi:hypothetical protein